MPPHWPHWATVPVPEGELDGALDGGTLEGGALVGTEDGACEGGMEVVPEKVEPRSPHLMLE